MSALLEAVEQFSLWRKGKRSRGDRIPDALWLLACRAASTQSISSVASRLGVTTDQIHSRMHLLEDGPNPVRAFSVADGVDEASVAPASEVIIGRVTLRIPSGQPVSWIKTMVQAVLEVA